MGAMDDQGVDTGDVKARFDDRSRDQHAVGTVVEGVHHGFQRPRREPTVGGGEAHLGHQLAQPPGGGLDILDARADVESLPAPEMLAQDRLAHDHRVVGHDEGAHRQAVDRRRGDQTELAYSGQRHLQGARDRRRGQGQHMDAGAQPLELLLVGDAEVLLLVDDQQAQALEADGPAQQRVGADDDVDLAALESRLDFGRALAGDQAREMGDSHRQTGEALAEGGEVLAAEQRRWRHHCDLPALHDGHEGGAQRDLGLAEAHVAADQPIHWPARAEIGHHLGDGTALVVGLDVGESGRRTPRTGPRAAPGGRRDEAGARRRRAAARPPSP